MLARACWYWNMPALNMAVAPLAFSSAGLFGNGGKTGGIPCQSDGGGKGGWEGGGKGSTLGQEQNRKKGVTGEMKEMERTEILLEVWKA